MVKKDGSTLGVFESQSIWLTILTQDIDVCDGATVAVYSRDL